MSELTHAGKVALITGITGQDGSYLTEFLLSKGYTVRSNKYFSCVWHLYSLFDGLLGLGRRDGRYMTCFALKSMRFFFLQVILLWA